jgi:hypothetical protein
MDNASNITCPKCGAEIPLTEAVSHRIREELAADFDKQRREQNAALAEREGKLAKLKNEPDQQAKKAFRNRLPPSNTAPNRARRSFKGSPWKSRSKRTCAKTSPMTRFLKSRRASAGRT